MKVHQSGSLYAHLYVFLLNCRKSKNIDELEVKVGVDQYAVPANIRTAVNHSIDLAAAASSSVAKEAERIRFLQIVL